MSRELQAKYSKNVKGLQRSSRTSSAVERVAKLPSGNIASRALKERGGRRNGNQ